MFEKLIMLSFFVSFALSANAGFIDARKTTEENIEAQTKPGSKKILDVEKIFAKPIAVNEAEANKIGSEVAAMQTEKQKIEVSASASNKKEVILIKAYDKLSLRPGMRLSHSIRDWLSERAIPLSWQAQGSANGLVRDFEIESAWSSSTNGLEQSLTEVLGPFGLEANLVRKEGFPEGGADKVIVRNATHTLQ